MLAPRVERREAFGESPEGTAYEADFLAYG